MKKLFIFNMAIIAITTLLVLFIIEDATAYTYEGKLDPKDLFTYKIIELEKISPIAVIMFVKKEKIFAVCVQIIKGGTIIVAYAYLDEDFNLKHFLFDGKGHYAEKMPAQETIDMLLKKLYKMNGITDAGRSKDDTNKSKES